MYWFRHSFCMVFCLRFFKFHSLRRTYLGKYIFQSSHYRRFPRFFDGFYTISDPVEYSTLAGVKTAAYKISIMSASQIKIISRSIVLSKSVHASLNLSVSEDKIKTKNRSSRFFHNIFCFQCVENCSYCTINIVLFSRFFKTIGSSIQKMSICIHYMTDL